MIKSFCTVLMTTDLKNQKKFYTKVLGLRELFSQDGVVGLGNRDQLYVVLRQETAINSHHQQENKGPIILTFQIDVVDESTIMARLEEGGHMVRDTLEILEHNIYYKFIEDCVYDNRPEVDLIKAYEVEKIVFAMKKSIDENRLINL